MMRSAMMVMALAMLVCVCEANTAVKWAQDNENLYVTVGPKCDGGHSSTIKENTLDLQCKGGNGQKHDVKIELREDIIPESSSCKLVKHELDCKLEKKFPHFFDRLAWDEKALHGFLKQDWSRWKDEEEVASSPDGPYEGVSNKYVHKLTSDKLKKGMETHDVLFVDIAFPWCSKCTDTVPAFVAAAKSMSSDKVMFGRVDAREERDVAKTYNVSCDSSCKYYVIRKGDDHETVKGSRSLDTEQFVNNLRSVIHPAVSYIQTEDELAAFKAAHPVSFVAFMKGGFMKNAAKSDEFKALKQAALNSRAKAAVAYTDKNLGKSKAPTIKLFKKGVEAAEDIKMQKDSAVLSKLFVAHSLEDLEAYEYAKRDVFDSASLSSALCFVDDDDAETEKVFKDLSAKFKGQIGFMKLGKHFLYMTQDVGLPNKLPGFAIQTNWKDPAALKYAYEGDLTLEKLTEFCTKFLDGMLEPTYKSEEEKQHWKRGLVKMLVKKTLSQNVGEKATEDALVLLHKPWSPGLEKVKQVFTKVSAAFEALEGITLGEFDHSKNYFDADVWTGVSSDDSKPHIFFCEAGVRACQLYTGPVSQKDVFKYLAKQSNTVKAGWEDKVKPQLKIIKEREAEKKRLEEEARVAAEKRKEEDREKLEHVLAKTEKEEYDGGKVVKQIITPGTGKKPNLGDTISAHYTGTLLDGTEFDSSRARGTPFSFELGKKMVISCWETGFENMAVGERAVLTCDPSVAYGERGSPPLIPPNSSLRFDVELLDTTAPATAKEEL